MKTAAVICELNPLHKGHRRLFSYCRERGAELVIALMSGDFVQRGIPAVTDRHTRAEALADYGELLQSPNNILGVEYVKAILKNGSAMKPVTLRREGALLTQHLGIRREAREWLGALHRGSVPLLVRPSAPPENMTEKEMALCREELHLANLYEALRSLHAPGPAVHACSKSFVTV